MPHTSKIALVQMRVEGGKKKRNLQHACDLLAQAAAEGAGWADRWSTPK